MIALGRVVRLQVQTGPLKRGEKPHRVYDAAALRPVERLVLSPKGAVGLTAAGESLMDIHHADHPATRNSGKNSVSLGFSSHYRAMRDRFGGHMADGCAGENILVEANEPPRLSDLGARLALQSAETGEVLELEAIGVAAPCTEFSRFALREPAATPQQVKPALQFLDRGTRGFYVTPAGDLTVRAGDALVSLG